MDALLYICPILACSSWCATLACCAFVCILAYASMVDMRERIIPDLSIACSIVVWVGAQAGSTLISSGSSSATAAAFGLIGACVLGAGSFCIGWLASVCSGRESLGAGDVKLLFAVGLYLGPFWGGAALVLACVLMLGAASMRMVAGCCRMFFHRGIGASPPRFDGTFPFAPFVFASVLWLLATLSSIASTGCA